MNLEGTTILEIGARGVLDGAPFTLAGRRCIRGRRGSVWNEWTLAGAPHVTLAESAGRFTLYREAPLVASVDDLVAGERLPWLVVERGVATSVAQWGDVPPAPASWAYADLSEVGPRGRRATVSGGSSFVGTVVEASALGLGPRTGAPALVPAPNVASPAGLQLWLDVGDRGSLEGLTWQVVGIVGRASDAGSTWEEYCVYAAGVGLRWLVVADGHWSMVTPVDAGGVTLEPEAEPDVVRVTWATGELPWAVEIGETVESYEVGALVKEVTVDDLTWSRQAPLGPDAIARAFDKRALPKPR